MKYALLILHLLTFTSCFSQKQGDSYIILISIDGLRPTMYKDTIWHTQNLQTIMQKGVYAEHIKSVFPAYTYPSHVAMMTGALPARSGIVHNVKDDAGNWNWFTKDIKGETLWQACKKNGLTTAAVEWPVSVGEEITYNIPEIWDTKHPSDRITTTRKYATPGLIEEIEKNVTGPLDSVNMNEQSFSLDLNSAKMAAYIYEKYKPNLLAVHFALVDGMEHEHGTQHDSVRLAVKNADKAIGILLDAINKSPMKDSTTIIIVGDHGFADIHQVLRPNQWLKQWGITHYRFAAAGGSTFLKTTGATSVQELATIEEKVKLLPEKQRREFRVMDRKELDMLGADSAAVLALAAKPGTIFSNSETGTQLSKTSGGHHGYDPRLPEMYTGFIAAGRGIRKGKRIKELCVTDIAPLIAKLLGVPFNCPDGKMVKGILKN